MNNREWLRKQGFTVGERGKLSPEMLTALKDYPGDTPTPKVFSVEVVEPEPTYVTFDSPQIRPARTLYGITREGYKVGFTTCRECTKHMAFCACPNGVVAPKIVIHSKDEEVYVSK